MPRREEVFPDERVLAALLGLAIRSPADLEEVRREYVELRETTPGAPSFDDVVSGGWIRVSGRRAVFDINPLDHPPADPALASILGSLTGPGSPPVYELPASRLKGKWRALGQRLTAEQRTYVQVACRRPEWVAARLWEESRTVADPVARLLFWHDRWVLLGAPSFVLQDCLSEHDAAAFMGATEALLRTDGTLLTWQAFTARHKPPRAVDGVTDAGLPTQKVTVVDRFLDLYSLIDEAPVHFLYLNFRFARLIDMLLVQMDATTQAPVPEPASKLLIDLLVRSPEVLAMVGLLALDHPRMLADLVLAPGMASLAALLIARHGQHGGAHDRSTLDPHDAMLRAVALEDAMAVFVERLAIIDDTSADVAEFAALLAQAFEESRFDRPISRRLFETARMAARGFPVELTPRLLGAMVERITPPALGTGAFAAALDLIGPAGLLPETHGGTLVAAYITSMRGAERVVRMDDLDTRGAVALGRLAMAAPVDLRADFFNAVDVRTRLNAIDRDQPSHLSEQFDVARLLREHIRLLARAVGGWPGRAPAELLAALRSNIHWGALDRIDKAQVDAFNARFETHRGRPQTSVADDLAVALDRLDSTARSSLLKAICESEEPVMLARLYKLAPPSCRSGIGERIAMLDMDSASAVLSLPELQQRIEALLDAGLPEAASVFMAAEKEMETWGPVPGRSATRVRATLWKHYLDGNVDAILQWQAAPDASPEEKDTIDFFRGLAMMTRPGPVPGAVDIFERLARKHRDAPGYVINAFAARLRTVLADDGLGAVATAHVAEANRMSAEAGAVDTAAPGWTDSHRSAFAINQALLLLALGHPDDALKILDSIKDHGSRRSTDALRAIAFIRLGRSGEATRLLPPVVVTDSGDGEDALVNAARKQIAEENPDALGLATTAHAGDDDLDPPLSHFRKLPASRQARAWGWHNQIHPREFIIEGVANVAARLVAIAPVIRPSLAGDDPDGHALENDITAFFQALLDERAGFMGWRWAEQPPGGITEKGNPGARDIALVEGGSTHAVIEAVICRGNVATRFNEGELRSHLKKLFGYSTCELFFLVVYSYLDAPETANARLRQMVRTEAPEGFVYTGTTERAFDGSCPEVFVAEYDALGRTVHVAILVIDLQQHLARNASSEAAAANPRRPVASKGQPRPE